MNIKTPDEDVPTLSTPEPKLAAMTETAPIIFHLPKNEQTQRVNSVSSVTLEKDQVIVRFKDHPKVVQFQLKDSQFKQEVCDPSGKVALKVAALQGNIEAVHVLREAGVTVDPTINEENIREIRDDFFTCIASYRGPNEANIEHMRAFIEAGVDLMMRDAKGRTLLLAALQELSDVQKKARNLDMEEENQKKYEDFKKKEESLKTIVNMLIEEACMRENKSDILNACIPSGSSALICALKTVSIEVVKKLKEAGVDITHQDRKGRTPLMHAILRENSLTKVKILTEGGTNTDINVHGPDGLTALMLAATSGKFERDELLQVLIGAHADVNARDSDGRTALMLAAKKGELGFDKVLEILKEAGVDINAADPSGRTALMFAAERGYLNIHTLQAFIKAGADINARDSNGQTALMLAVQHGIHPDAFQEFINAGADIHACDASGRTALALAEKEKLKNLFSRDTYGNTSLMLAAENENLELLQALLKAGIKAGIDIGINIADRSGFTALMKAVLSKKNSIEMVRALIEGGGGKINIDAYNRGGYTALMFALSLNMPQTIVDLLVRNGANLPYAMEFLDRKELAHAWGIKGSTPIRDPSGEIKQFKVEGMQVIHALHMLSGNVKKFFKTDQLAKQYISKDDRLEIQECIENACPLKKMVVSETVERIKRGKPFMILEGAQYHGVGIVIRGRELFVCNRGEESCANGSQRFLLSSDIDENMLLELTTTYSSMGKFNGMIKKMENDKKLQPAGGVRQKEQEVENCTLASSKAAFAVLCLLYTGYTNWGPIEDTGAKGKKESIIPKVGSIKGGGEVYKRFGTYLRITKLNDYLDKFKKPWFKSFSRQPLPQLQRADDMLLKIQDQCSKNSKKERPEFKEIQAMLSGMQLKRT